MVAPRPAENARMLLQEIRTTAYRRAFALGKGIDANAIEAGCAEGVLTVTLRKSAKVQPREITITS
jgi:HSP20 family molecular chaperone IbpA